MCITVNGFTEEGNWYKGNLHCHTTDSDGSLNPSEAVKLYKEQGYSFLAISDHDIYSDYRDQFDCEDFIILPAIEASAVLYKDENRNRAERLSIHHIHGILGNEKMQREAKKGLFTHLEKYPTRQFCAAWDGAKTAQELQDDLKAHESIINAMIDGNYYSSSGPQIYDWGIKNDVAYVKCSPVSRVNFMAGNYINAGYTTVSESGKDDITQAEFHLRGNEAWRKKHGKL